MKKRLLAIMGMMVLVGAGAGALVFLASGCATLGGGPLVGPPLNWIVGKNVLVNAAPLLAQQAEYACNAQAYVEYNASVAVCEGKLEATIPVNFGSATGAVQILCQSLGYTNPANQIAVPEQATLGGCPKPAALKG
jgi:hypothetical protein